MHEKNCIDKNFDAQIKSGDERLPWTDLVAQVGDPEARFKVICLGATVVDSRLDIPMSCSDFKVLGQVLCFESHLGSVVVDDRVFVLEQVG